VEEGRAQAKRVATGLSQVAYSPDVMCCSSLKRTKEFAEIIKKECRLTVSVVKDKRLNELDYGWWGGLTSEQIAARGSVVDLQQWNDRGVWPLSAGFSSSPSEIVSELRFFLNEIYERYGSKAEVLAVTSNGRLKFLLQFDTNALKIALDRESVKVKTGHAVVAQYDGRHLTIEAWNVPPQELSGVLDGGDS
jgi:probable phosphoglycerate mutase